MLVGYKDLMLEISLNEISKWTEFQCKMAILESNLNEQKRRILKEILKNKDLVIEMLALENPKEALEDLPEVDYGNTGMKGMEDTPFKILRK